MAHSKPRARPPYTLRIHGGLRGHGADLPSPVRARRPSIPPWRPLVSAARFTPGRIPDRPPPARCAPKSPPGGHARPCRIARAPALRVCTVALTRSASRVRGRPRSAGPYPDTPPLPKSHLAGTAHEPRHLRQVNPVTFAGSRHRTALPLGRDCAFLRCQHLPDERASMPDCPGETPESDVAEAFCIVPASGRRPALGSSHLQDFC